MTGTSWTTIATIGIALMGIGDALGIPAPIPLELLSPVPISGINSRQ